MLEIKGLTVSYGEIMAVNDVNITINEGELVAVVGSNGAGKTTLLNTISGLLRPRNGAIKFLGENIEKCEPQDIVKKGIAQVPEGRKLFPNMTVLENLEMGAIIPEARKYKKDSFERVFELFPRLKERVGQAASTMSGGEQQMLAVGRALMSRPKLIMLDEPSLGLAPKMVQKIFDIAQDINKQGTTVILIEQNVSNSLTICERAYVLENGSVSVEGKGKDLLNNEYVKKAYMGI